MTNEGNKLTIEILQRLGFEKNVDYDNDGDEVKTWNKDHFDIYENSWWIKNGVSCYEPGEKEPEITFTFATVVRGGGGFKSGFSITTDQQLKNLFFALRNKELMEDADGWLWLEKLGWFVGRGNFEVEDCNGIRTIAYATDSKEWMNTETDKPVKNVVRWREKQKNTD